MLRDDSDYYHYHHYGWDEYYDYDYNYDYNDEYDEILMDSYYPCIKYKKPANPKYDGADYFIVAESMNLKIDFVSQNITCSLSFTCENDQKAFYKLIKDCLRFRIHDESLCDFCKQ